MSGQSHLPPRSPFVTKSVSRTIQGSHYPQHHKSPSLGSIPEEQPAWLEDLLSEEVANPNRNFLCRSASDSVTLLDDLVDSFSDLNPHNNESDSVENETCSRLESGSVYGPNSPRRRGNVTFSENAIASALSEYVYQNPTQRVDGSLCVSHVPPLGLEEDACGSVGELNADMKTAKRQSGQRSRVRKLQYIAELERRVSVVQNLESELAIRVASLLQKRAALSMENSKLKQQVARVRQEKLIVDGEYKYLKKEVERLRKGLPNSPNSSKMRAHFVPRHPSLEAPGAEASWKMLDMSRLNLI